MVFILSSPGNGHNDALDIAPTSVTRSCCCADLLQTEFRSYTTGIHSAQDLLMECRFALRISGRSMVEKILLLLNEPWLDSLDAEFLARVYSPDPAHRERFVRETQRADTLAIEAVGNPQEAMQGADIVVLATNSLNPVIQTEWLEPGMHVTCVRHPEIGKESYAKCDTVVLNSKKNFNVSYFVSKPEQGQELIGEVLSDYVKGYPPGEVKDIDWDNLPDLPDLILGVHPGRTSAAEITCFDNSVGFGLQFAALAGKVYEMARAKGLGTEAPDDPYPGVT